MSKASLETNGPGKMISQIFWGFENRYMFGVMLSLEIFPALLQIPSPRYLMFSYKIEKRGLMSSFVFLFDTDLLILLYILVLKGL